MYSLRASYLKVFLIILLSLPSLFLRSQVVVGDTTQYAKLLTEPDVQRSLDYALMHAAALGNTEGIDWLMRHGADVNTKTMENVSPLMFAVASEEKEAVKVLLKYKPELDFFTGFNESPLILAVKNQDIEIAEMLLRDSADVDLKDRHGFSALHLAVIYGDFYMVDMLLYYDADVNIKSSDGTTPLMVSVYGGYADIADLLIQNRARVKDTDNEGFTPLMIAAQNNDTLLLDLLIRKGADIYSINKYKYDALDLAIKLNNIDAVKYLLSKERKPTSSEKGSQNPYSVAAVYRRKEIVDLLRTNKVPEVHMKGLDQVSLGVSVRACFHDLYTGFSLVAREPYRGYGFFAGFDTKPGWSRVLVKESENLYYQYMDKSSMVYAGVLRDFSLSDNVIKGNWFFSCSLGGGLSFGNKFKGSETGPDTKFRLLPAVGFRYNKDAVNLTFNLEYTRTDFYRIGPVWLRAGISYNLFFNNLRAPGKIIKW